MIVDQLNVMSAISGPTKDDSPLSIHPNRIELLKLTNLPLRSVGGRDAQILQPLRRVNVLESSQCASLEIYVQLLDLFSGEYLLGPLIGEAIDHESSLSHNTRLVNAVRVDSHLRQRGPASRPVLPPDAVLHRIGPHNLRTSRGP